MSVANWKWSSFEPEEVLSPEGLLQLKRGVMLISPYLLDTLQAFRNDLGVPILINHKKLNYRGYRSPRENYKIVKGETYSFHMQGLAADCSCPSLSWDYFVYKATSFPLWKGIGLYKSMNFIHLDIRPSLDGSVTKWER